MDGEPDPPSTSFGVAALLLLTLIVAFVLLLALLLGVGIIAALCLHWLWPGVELGTWIIACVIGAGFSVHFLARTVSFMRNFRSDEDTEPGQEETVIVFPDYLPHLRRRPRRKKGSS